MNRKLIFKILGAIVLIEAAAMVPALILALCYGDGDAMALLQSIIIMLVSGSILWFTFKPKNNDLRAHEGLFIVSFGWIIMSLFGALPFIFSQKIPNFADALFEAVSGFTTTGATVLTEFEGFPRGIMFWRASTHWIGGMGVLVLTLAILPKVTGRTNHLVRAESPGPVMSKLVPKMGDSAKILYFIYFGLTVLEFIALLICGLSPYDAVLHAMSTAGTGGFSNYGDSIAAFNSPAVEIVVTVFMFLFGINFALFFKVLIGSWKEALHDEELRWYTGIYLFASILMIFMIRPICNDTASAIRYGFFQVASLTSTTGFGLLDVNRFSPAGQGLLILLLFLGSCAGSTAGGMKTIRIILVCKMGKREISSTLNPRRVKVVRMDGKAVDEDILHQVAVFCCLYVILIVVGSLLLSLSNNYGAIENFTAALTCVSNVGPALGGISSSFAGYNSLNKLICCFLMLAGRLELFPLFVLMHPGLWKNR